MTADPYRFWRAALALVGDCGKLTREQVAAIGGITTEPCCGFWRKPVRGLTPGGKPITTGWLPVAIWHDGSGYLCLVDGRAAEADDAWTSCAVHPVSEHTYRRVAEAREWWPGEDAA